MLLLCTSSMLGGRVPLYSVPPYQSQTSQNWALLWVLYQQTNSFASTVELAGSRRLSVAPDWSAGHSGLPNTFPADSKQHTTTSGVHYHTTSTRLEKDKEFWCTGEQYLSLRKTPGREQEMDLQQKKKKKKEKKRKEALHRIIGWTLPKKNDYRIGASHILPVSTRQWNKSMRVCCHASKAP